MAGIGFELKKIYSRKTLAANIYGTVYATVTTVGPAVISGVLMILLKRFLETSDAAKSERELFIISVTYIFIIAQLIASIFATPLSRYISDCIYIRKEDRIFPSAFGVLAVSTAISGIIMAALCAAVYLNMDNIPAGYLTAYYLLGVLMTNSYGIMTYASALKHYKPLTAGFLAGFILAVGLYFACSKLFLLSKATAACASLALCYFTVLIVLMFQCAKTFGKPKGPCFPFMTYLKKYPKLSLGNFAYVLGMYAPTVIYWAASDRAYPVGIFRTFPSYDTALFMSIVTAMPSLIIFVVKVETAFYEKYTRYVSALNTSPLDMLQKERNAMNRTLKRQLSFVYEIQFVITVVIICIAGAMIISGIDTDILTVFCPLSLGTYAVFGMYFAITVFHYFSDYNSACAVSVIFMLTASVGAAIAAITETGYSLPLGVGGLVGWACALLMLRQRMKNLDKFLMC